MTIFLSITSIVFAIAFGYFARRAYVLAGLLADSDDHHESVEMTNM